MCFYCLLAGCYGSCHYVRTYGYSSSTTTSTTFKSSCRLRPSSPVFSIHSFAPSLLCPLTPLLRHSSAPTLFAPSLLCSFPCLFLTSVPSLRCFDSSPCFNPLPFPPLFQSSPLPSSVSIHAPLLLCSATLVLLFCFNTVLPASCVSILCSFPPWFQSCAPYLLCLNPVLLHSSAPSPLCSFTIVHLNSFAPSLPRSLPSLFESCAP
jgi:hypothetical protein